MRKKLAVAGEANMLDTQTHGSERATTLAARQQQPANAWRNEAREIRTPNLLIWNQTRCRCAIAPLDDLVGFDDQLQFST